MSEAESAGTGAQQQASQEDEQGAAAGEEAKQFDEQYVKKLRDEAAKYRTEAKANAEAAKRLAALEEAQKSEADKAADRLRQLEADVNSARLDALRFKIASKHQISDEDADLFLTGSDEETLTRQAERLAAHTKERKKNGNVVPNEGATSKAAPNDERAFVRELFGNG